MKRFLFLLGIIITATGSGYASVGGVDGGGGKSIVCRDDKDQIQSVEILDLFEGRAQYGLNYSESQKPWSEQIDEVMAKASLSDPSDWLTAAVTEGIQVVKENMKLLSPDARLLPIDDSVEVIAPVGCKVEQSVNFRNDRSILFDSHHWNAMSQTQKAALILHEAIYREMRLLGEKNSRRARHFTAFIFSGGKIEGTSQPDSSHLILCGGTDDQGRETAFWVYRTDSDNTNQKIGIQFLELNGRTLLSKSSLENYSMSFNGSDVDVLSQLTNPTQSGWIIGDTASSFEPGDHINFVSYQEYGKGPFKLKMRIKSAIDDSHSAVPITCQNVKPF